MTAYALVGDVGGTNVRLALCDISSGAISHVETFSTHAFDTLEAAVHHYLVRQQKPVQHGCIAIACPVGGDWVEMTNHNWSFSVTEMRCRLGLESLEMINDFTAISMAIPALQEKDLLQFGGKKAVQGQPVAVYGAGTGLGVAHLIRAGNRWISLPGEGGHVDFAPGSKEESLILEILRSELGHISAERILSGAGLVNLYRAVVKSDGRQPENLQPQDISQRAVENRCSDCHRALALFCIALGRFGGNLALNLATLGGVYLAGGVVPRFLEFFKASGFRAAFEDKGRFRGYVQAIPVYLIMHEQPGLLGAGTYLRQSLTGCS
ncbi:glucokinase [Enterobacteriaceae bacterium LUAb1]